MLGLIVFTIITLDIPTPMAVDDDRNEPTVKFRIEKIITKLLSTRLVSWFSGQAMSTNLPVVFREPMYRAYGNIYGVNWDDINETQLSEYTSIQKFFTRKLPTPRIPSHTLLTNPVDGKVVALGEIDMNKKRPILDQVKGVPYYLDSFLGEIPKLTNKKNKLFYITMYLSPGDYHRFHSSCDWIINKHKHFVGDLYPVKLEWMERFQDLLIVNERVVLTGKWNNTRVTQKPTTKTKKKKLKTRNGKKEPINERKVTTESLFFSYTAVGALNVGSIKLKFNKTLATNQRPDKKTEIHENIYQPKIKIEKGEDMGHFEFGSTVVLIFESTPDFQFCVNVNQKVRMSEPLGDTGNTKYCYNLMMSKKKQLEEESKWSYGAYTGLKNAAASLGNLLIPKKPTKREKQAQTIKKRQESQKKKVLDDKSLG